MKQWIVLLAALSSAKEGDYTHELSCNEYYFDMLSTSTIYIENYAYSGKFLNGFGSYLECNGDLNTQANNTERDLRPQGYESQILKNKYGLVSFVNQSAYDRYTPRYVLGLCIYDGCSFQDQEAFAGIISQVADGTAGMQAKDVEFYFPKDVMEEYKTEVAGQYWFMVAIIIFVVISSFIGFCIESSTIGDLKLDENTREALNIDFESLQMHPVLVRKLREK